MRDNELQWKQLGNISAGFTTEVMRVPGGFLFRCIGMKNNRDDQPSIALEFVKTHDVGMNRGTLHDKLVKLCDN